ncbi:MAG: hypothetical protein WEB87_04920 [Bacteriovoracaceae bacterium]
MEKNNLKEKSPAEPLRERFKKWLYKGSLRPLILGDEHMAFRLHSFFLNDDIFTCFDSDSLFEEDLEPNYIVLFGPVNEKLQKRFEAIRGRLKNPGVLYVESVFDSDGEAAARSKMGVLNIEKGVVGEFVTMANIKEALVEAANV